MTTSSLLAAFAKQSYLNLETYRKTGQAMPTPVWFVEDQGKLYVRTVANSGKVKRVRNNPRVRVAPCEGSGKLKSEWAEAEAHLVSDPSRAKAINDLLTRKYGLAKRLFDVREKFSKTAMDTIEIVVR
jgi:PPOX class probable F420-dependent enzyme